MRSRRSVLLIAALLALALPVSVAADASLDNPAPPPGPTSPPSPTFTAGGPQAKWEPIATIATGNPQTDLDFFVDKGETFASVGTLAAGANGGGQTIVKLTDQGKVVPKVVTSHPSAACVSNPSAALSLQHDVEATPKGGTILNTPNSLAAPGDAQLLLDATDAGGRCHDQGTLGLAQAPRGGLEIIDIADDPAKPKEIGLVSQIGEAHTVNVDPKRPQIAFSVTSDSVAVDANGVRANEQGESFALDGFELVDLSSCLNFAPGTTLQAKRDRCRPEVYRYRYPSAAFAQGHQKGVDARGIFACHETEIYPDDRLTCGSGAASIVFDLKGAFDDRGTPNDLTDDKPRGEPLPCAVRKSSTIAPAFQTGAMVTDCVTGLKDGKAVDLRVPGWKAIGAPSVAGVEQIGTAFHQGRGAGGTASTFKSDEDVDFSHEAELSGSGRFLLAADERGGGVAPPGAACDNQDAIRQGNGGVHFYDVTKLRKEGTTKPEEAFASYARTPAGKKAIFRVPIRTGANATICTAHVMQQIPGQNRIFIAWYSQGTQVFDFTENEDGTITFKEAGFFIPANANQWVSQVFKVDRNADGSFTYFGAAGDFNLGQGRSAIDVYKVTLPPPPTPRLGNAPAAMGTPEQGGVPAVVAGKRKACAASAGLRSVTAKRAGRGLRLGFTGAGSRPVDIDVFQVSRGSTVLTERLVKRFRGKRKAFTWNGRARNGRSATSGNYIVRYRIRGSKTGNASLRLALRRSSGRFRAAPAFEKRVACDTLRNFKLERPVFGGRGKTPLRVAVRLTRKASVGVELIRNGRTVRTIKARSVDANRTARLRVSQAGLARGLYEVRITVRQGRTVQTATLNARRI